MYSKNGCFLSYRTHTICSRIRRTHTRCPIPQYLSRGTQFEQGASHNRSFAKLHQCGCVGRSCAVGSCSCIDESAEGLDAGTLCAVLCCAAGCTECVPDTQYDTFMLTHTFTHFHIQTHHCVHSTVSQTCTAIACWVEGTYL